MKHKQEYLEFSRLMIYVEVQFRGIISGQVN